MMMFVNERCQLYGQHYYHYQQQLQSQLKIAARKSGRSTATTTITTSHTRMGLGISPFVPPSIQPAPCSFKSTTFGGTSWVGDVATAGNNLAGPGIGAGTGYFCHVRKLRTWAGWEPSGGSGSQDVGWDRFNPVARIKWKFLADLGSVRASCEWNGPALERAAYREFIIEIILNS